jgi:hypothetical protein
VNGHGLSGRVGPWRLYSFVALSQRVSSPQLQIKTGDSKWDENFPYLIICKRPQLSDHSFAQHRQLNRLFTGYEKTRKKTRLHEQSARLTGGLFEFDIHCLAAACRHCACSHTHQRDIAGKEFYA